MSRSPKLPAVILAGGFGTRLREIISDRPKPMALINDRPFLEYLLAFLYKSEAVSHLVISVGHRHEQITSYFGNSYSNVPITYSIEGSPLGTGGAVLMAADKITNENFFLFNGDTMFTIDFDRLLTEHHSLGADITIALKPMRKFDRYGTVVCSNGKITGFEEKRKVEEGLINGGVYIIRKVILNALSLPPVFSLEKDLLQAYVGKLKMAGVVFEDYFIDIGIPKDLIRARSEFCRIFPTTTMPE